jgi:transposase-like protein
VRHERWWVHKLRNLFDDVRRRYHAGIKPDAQRVYLARDAG